MQRYRLACAHKNLEPPAASNRPPGRRAVSKSINSFVMVAVLLHVPLVKL